MEGEGGERLRVKMNSSMGRAGQSVINMQWRLKSQDWMSFLERENVG